MSWYISFDVIKAKQPFVAKYIYSDHWNDSEMRCNIFLLCLLCICLLTKLIRQELVIQWVYFRQKSLGLVLRVMMAGLIVCVMDLSIISPHYPMRQYTEHTKLFSQKQLMVLSKQKTMYQTIQTWGTPFYTEQILQTKFCSFLQSLISLKRPILAHEGIFLHGNWFLSFKDI